MNPTARRVLHFALVPIAGYVLCYFILTFPLVLNWRSAYFCDKIDGPQMIWNLWWVRHALLDLHRLPWHTSYLHFPHGTSLLLHSLTPMNGLLSVPLSWFLGPVTLFNTIITFTFAANGLTCFWLAYRTTRAYWPSLAAGFAFAFCSYRWAHAAGHLMVISSEFIPLFMLAWLELLQRPRVSMGIAAGAALFAVLLCDQHQGLTVLLAGAFAGAWHVARARGLGPWRSRAGVISLLAFGGVLLVTVVPLVTAMLLDAYRSPLSGLHDPEHFSADLLGPFVPDWPWQWHALTQRIWQPIGAYAETSVCVGPAILIAAAWGCQCGGRTLLLASKWFWLALAGLFFALSCGPTLYFWTIPLTRCTPYRLLETLLPSLRFAGIPARMMIIVQLACCVLAAAGLARLATLPRRRRLLLGTIFLLLMVIESQPRMQLTYPPDAPQWVQVVRDDPQAGAVIDLIARGHSGDLYAQTIHRRPIAFGDISRLHQDTKEASERLVDQVERGEFAALANDGFAFIVIGASEPPLPVPLVHEDRFSRLYRLDPKR
jgi:hypothetical protein